jgi:hypothetical protein
MRAVFAILVGLACPLSAAAQTAGDRYGPTSVARLNQAASEAYQGRALSWANKQAAVQTNPGQALPSAPTPYRQQPTYAPFQPQVPLPLQQQKPVAAVQPQRLPQRLPTSIYGQAAPTPAAAVAPAPVRQTAPAPAPRAVEAPPQRLAAATPGGVGGAPRFYSVHRGYGMTPDAIPEPPAGDRFVLIGPPDAPQNAKTDDDDAPDARPGAF